MQAFLGFSVIYWAWIEVDALAALEPAVAFVAALAWLPFKKFILPWLM